MEGLKAYSALRACGLSDYEVRAYVALCLQGPSTARQVADAAGIPYTKVYDTLSRLERKGMVEVLEGRPMKYRALPPSHVAENVKAQLSRVAAQAEEALVEELQPLYVGVGGEGFVRLIKSWSDVDAALRSTASSAQRELLVHVGWLDPYYMEAFVDQVVKAAERGVEVRIVVSRSYARSKELARLARVAEVRLAMARAALPINVLVADGSQALFILASKPRRGRVTRRLAVRFAVKELAELVKEYVELVWEASSKIEESLSQREEVA